MKYAKQNLSFRKLVLTSAMTLVASGAFTALMADSAYAQRNNKSDEAAEQEGRQFSSKSGERVREAQNFMTNNDNASALRVLNEVIGFPDLNPYERSTIYQMQGAVYYELNNYNSAIQSFENAISAGGFNATEIDNLRVNIAQLLIGSGQYAKGAEMLENWSRNGGTLKPNHIEMLVQAWVQSENYTRALPWAEKWFQGANPKERKHFDLLNFLYNNLKMPGKQADIVKDMITRWPEDKTLWESWASLLANGGREQEAFEVRKMLYLGGALKTDQELSQVVQYYSFYDMPYQAAIILEREMNAGRITQTNDRLVQLSKLFRQAREHKRAMHVLEKAARDSEQANFYAELGECHKAKTALKKAVDQGYDVDKLWMAIGTCRYEDAQKEGREFCEGTTSEQRKNSEKNKKRNYAIAAFSQVSSNSREYSNARKWITFINAEAKAYENRCVVNVHVFPGACFIKIRQAYDAQVFTGKFELDAKCNAFKPKFDKFYKQTAKDVGAQ